MEKMAKGCSGCLLIALFFAGAVYIYWTKLPPASDFANNTIIDYAANWDFEVLKPKLHPLAATPEQIKNWEELSDLLKARVGPIQDLKPVSFVQNNINPFGSTYANYSTTATVIRSGSPLSIAINCEYSTGKWHILALQFNGRDILDLPPVQETPVADAINSPTPATRVKD